jgi:hypothetical protein
MAVAGDGEDEDELTRDDAEDDVSGTVEDEELVARDGVDVDGAEDEDEARRMYWW